MPRKVEISHRTIVFVVLLLAALWLVFQIRDVIFIIFVAFIIMSALNPLVDRLQKLRLPRSLSILIVYIIVWGLIGSVLAIIIRPLFDQTTHLLTLLPAALGRIELFSNNQEVITTQFLNRIGTLPADIFKFIVEVFGNLLSVFTTLVISFYMLLERRNLDEIASSVFGHDNQGKVSKIITTIETRLGGWVRGEIVLMFSIGIMTYVGLSLLGVEIALPLAIIAGILEVVPNIGPTISAVPAVLVALTIHPFTAIATVALYILIQLLENNLLVPHIMRRAVGVNPLVSILSLMIGLRLAGPAGAVLAIPLVIVAQTTYNLLTGER